jgi:microsomal dipeptidase-like Zn-dependent dipeptidase
VRKKLIAAAVLAGLLVFFLLLPRLIDRVLNSPWQKGSWRGSELSRAIVASAQPVDLHADPLLWGRDLLQRASYGAVDLPRLLEGGFAVQVFGVVTQAPRGMKVLGNGRDDADLVTALAVSSLWPPATWQSRRERALHQAGRLREMAARSGGQMFLLRTREDLRALLDARKAGDQRVGALLALEGSQALEGKAENIDALFAAGFRMMAPAHFTDTEVGGSAHGTDRKGLTSLGILWLQRLEELRIVIDLAHASPQTFEEVIGRARRPVVVSHSGVKATCDTARNLSDAQLSAVAANGGVVGIGYFEAAVCGRDVEAIARAVRHAANVMGVQHVALGSDWDGAVRTPFDATGLPVLVDALRAKGFTDADLRAILGGNALRVLSQSLP